MTLVECVCLALLVALLAGLFLPLATSMHGPSRSSICGRNQKQIMTACIAYSQDEQVAWPMGSHRSTGKMNAHDGRLITGEAFEVLAAAMDVPNKLFVCDRNGAKAPGVKARGDGGNADQWTKAAMSFAFDWSAPGEPSTKLVVLADRSPANHGNKGSNMSYSDGHFRFQKVGTGVASGSLTEISDGTAVTFIVANPDAVGSGDGSDQTLIDNIYDTNGDQAKDPLAPLGGSSWRSWIK